MAFMAVCPGNKRTKETLWPIIEENIAKGSIIHSDGWKAYRKLPEVGYAHRWVNHTEHYVDPSDRTLHTNKIEGFWGCWKRWLPSSGPYNLEEYLYAYLWFHQKKINGEDPFWSLVKLVSENNSQQVLKEALMAKPDMIGESIVEANIGMIEGDLDQGSNSSEDLQCPFCEAYFDTTTDLEQHVESNCEDSQIIQCPFCEQIIKDQEKLVEHVDCNH